MKIQSKYKTFFIHENASGNIVCEMVTMMSKGRWVNGLSPVRCQAISWTNTGLLLNGTLGVNNSQCFSYWNSNIFIIPPAQRSCWGVYWFHSVRPSVCPSVRPSVRPSVPHAVSALYHLQLWMVSFHIRHKWSLPWEGVSCTMTFDLDLYLQGHLALT